MSKRRLGLQKQISSIFTGVPVPKDDAGQQILDAPAPESTEYAPPKAVPPQPAEPKPAVQKPAEPKPSVQKPVAPSHLKPSKPKPKEPLEPSPPKAAPSKRPTVDVPVRTARQIPWQKTWQQIQDKLFASKLGASSAKQKVMVVVMPVLFVALIFVFVRGFSTPSGKTGDTKDASANAFAGSVPKIEWQIPEPYPTTLRDPMRFGPVSTNEVDDSGLVVRGIVFSEDEPSAVIGTQILYEGDEVLGATIVKVNIDSVEFERDGKKWTQKVQQ
jgi:hypothetical protein